MKLYELAAELQAFMDANEAGLIPEEAYADTLEGIQLPFVDKVEGCALAYKGMMAEAKEISEEEKRLKERRQKIEKEAGRLASYIDDCFKRSAGGQKPAPIKTPRAVVSYRASSVVEVDDMAKLLIYAADGHGDLLTVKDPEPNKTAIKAAIKAGEAVPGAAIVERYNLQIK